MEFYRIESVDDLTPELISSLITRYKQNEVPRIKKLYNYYLGNSDIKKRTMSDSTKPNNKIDNNFAGYITDTVNGYFMGSPVRYQSQNKELMTELQKIFDKSHEETHNARVAKDLSITGAAYELLYVNEKKEVKLANLDPAETFLIFDTTIEENILAGVRFLETVNYVDDTKQMEVYVYTEDEIRTYVYSEDKLSLADQDPHPFNQVPIVFYRNNEECVGDFEKVMDLHDAYNKAVSNTANDFDYFSDSYLVIKGLELEDENDLNKMKENRVIQFDDPSGSVQWLTKASVDMGIEEYKNRLKKDIVLFSGVPDLSDENFGSNLSSIAIRWKLNPLEQKVAIKENYFTESLERRIELISAFLAKKTTKTYDYSEVKITFNRNLPVNKAEEADWAIKMKGILSDETILANLSVVDDPAKELGNILKAFEDTYPAYDFENASEPSREAVDSEDIAQ